MKQNLLSFFAVTISLPAMAQFTVFHNGNANVGSDVDSCAVKLSVGSVDYDTQKYDVFFSAVSPSQGCYNIAAEGLAVSDAARSKGRAIGVRGIAGNCTNGYNYGVMGCLSGSRNGTGLFGSSTGNILGACVDGKYAGYFSGNVSVTGLLKSSLVNIADYKVTTKQSASSVSNALEAVVQMNPIKYSENVSTVGPGLGSDSLFSTNSVTNDVITSIPLQKDHYALPVSVVKELYPSLVLKDSEGREYVNYTELLPILVRSIIELNDKIEELQATLSEVQSQSAMTLQMPAVSSVVKTELFVEDVALSQNTPNPFKGQTTIHYSLPAGSTNASICLYSNDGQVVGKYPVSSSSTGLQVDCSALKAGMYIYALVVDGKTVATKRMVISK